LVEYLLPKQKVAGSSPVSRSRFSTNIFGPEPYCPERGVRTVRAQAIKALYAGKRKTCKAAPDGALRGTGVVSGR
jgi:hypothetical protein